MNNDKPGTGEQQFKITLDKKTFGRSDVIRKQSDGSYKPENRWWIVRVWRKLTGYKEPDNGWKWKTPGNQDSR